MKRLIGLTGSGAWALLARSVLEGRPASGIPSSKGPLIFLRSEESELEDIADAFLALGQVTEGAALPVAFFGEEESSRLKALERLRSGARLILTTPAALAKPTLSSAAFGERTVAFSRGERRPRSETVSRLAEAGYRRVDFVESPGEFAVRGAVLDFFSWGKDSPVRVLYDEDTVASLREFDPVTQTVSAMLERARAIPAAESGEQAQGEAFLIDWLGTEGAWVVEDGLSLPRPDLTAYEAGRLLETSAADLDFGCRPLPPFGGSPKRAWEEMAALARQGFSAVLFGLNAGELARAQELMQDVVPPGSCRFLAGGLRQGFLHEALKLCVLSTSEIFQRDYRNPGRWKYFPSASGGSLRPASLKAGDYVVHQDYGVGRYERLEVIESPGSGTVDCMALGFRGADKLFVPMYEFEKIKRYSVLKGARPRLSSLDTRGWEEIKAKVREDARELAEALLKLQAARTARPGHAFPPESAMEREFAAAFPFEETPDQARAIQDVLRDMEAPQAMDRLVVGDVGFGKTEVAMRAAFKAAAAFKQTAVLVPTTILAQQHYRTFRQRFADYPVRVGVITRFQTPAEQKKTLQDAARGVLDILIGTSRLLQKDVAFKDLGLVIIDEEHRFGVKDKERLKLLRDPEASRKFMHGSTGVGEERPLDCLSLSATPIPRSLHQALSGLRSLSLIESAPQGREPIQTTVAPLSEELIRRSILFELARGGQAYYVFNRVRGLPQRVERLARLLRDRPGGAPRLAMVHGRMKSAEIEKVMWEFCQRKYDVLVASTIIESGLDIPTVNTLIVEEAQEFGLAQLYQLRGRIGRERLSAHCLLLYPPDLEGFAALNPEARARLEALKEFGALGVGIRLALRDLEIRGAGDLLGLKQHGALKAVGAEFYSQLLEEEILEGRGAQAEAAPKRELVFDVAARAYLPERYLPGESARLDFYKRLLHAPAAGLSALAAELEALSGPLPPPAQQLFTMLRLRALARDKGVRSLVQKDRVIEVLLDPGLRIGAAHMERWTRDYGAGLRFVRQGELEGLRVELGQERPLEWIESFLRGL